VPEKTKKDARSSMIHLSASQIIDLIVERHLAQMGWNPKTKAFDREPIICRPIVMVGPAGIGKSEVPAQAAKKIAEIIEASVATRDCNLQFLEAPDLAGLGENVTVDGERVTVHGRPGLLPTTGRGIWFLDEPNRVNRDIRSAMLTLIQARRVNDYQVGKDWMIVMAMNPSEYAGVSYEVSEWDRALRDRVTFVWFDPSIKELMDYLREKYGNHIVLRWVESAGLNSATNHLLAFHGEEDRITPRGLEFLIRAINAAGGISSPNWFRAAVAEVGKDLAALLSAFVSTIKSVTAEEILDSWNEEVSQKLKDLEADGRFDALSTVAKSVSSLLYTRYDEGLALDAPESKKMIANVRAFMEQSPADLINTFFLNAGERLQTLPNKILFPTFVKELMRDSNFLQRHFATLKEVHKAAEKLARGE